MTESGEAKLTVPRGTPRYAIDAFLDEHREWLVQSVDDATSALGESVESPPEYLELPAAGERWRLEVQQAPGASRRQVQLRPSVSERDFTLRIHAADVTDAATLQSMVRRQLSERARVLFSEWIAELAPAMGVTPGRLQVRNQQSVWGSCSSRGTISLNYAGMFLEPELARYLCIHELAHLRHMNHSDAFWDFVMRFEPDALFLDSKLGRTHDIVPKWLW